MKSLWIRLGVALGALAFALRIRRRVTLENLARAFPETSAAELRALARAAYVQLGRSLGEILAMRGMSDAQLEQLVRFDGWERYEAVRARGVVCAVGHFGNFELLARAVARRGVSLSIIVRSLQGGFNDWLFGSRIKTGVKHLPDKGSSSAAVALLRRGEVLAIAIDQNMMPKRGIFVPFFGVPACTTPAAAVYAQRADAALIAAFPVRQPDGTHVVKVLGPFETAQKGHSAVEDLTAQLTRAVEDQVRQHPDHWFWLHRRWKTRP